MTTIAGVNVNDMSEEAKTDQIPATTEEMVKYFSATPKDNKRLRGRDVSRRATPGNPTNEDTRVLMAFLRKMRDALFTGEWADSDTLEVSGTPGNEKIHVKDVLVDAGINGSSTPFYLAGHKDANGNIVGGNVVFTFGNQDVAGVKNFTSSPTVPVPGATDDSQKAANTKWVRSLFSSTGGFSFGDDGKVYVDFSQIDPAIMRAIVLAMVQSGGGIAVDQNGQLYVDFGNMPTDKFEEMLKSLKMLVPLTSDRTFYVNQSHAAAGDTIIDGRGTSSKPFLTIQGAVNYVTSTFSLGSYSVYIRVVAGTYNENVRLPDFSRGTGYIQIMSDSGQRDVIVNAQTNSYGTCGTPFAASNGGTWRIRHMDVRRVENPTTAKGQASSCFYAANGAVLIVLGCSAMQSMPASPTPLGGENYSVRVFAADLGGTIQLSHDVLRGAISTQKPASGTPSVTVLSALRGGTIQFNHSYDEDQDPVTTGYIDCSGSCHTFANASGGAKMQGYGGGNPIVFVDADANNPMTGKRYGVEGGSFINGTGSTSYFPGDTAGTVDDGNDGRPQTYCWYA